MNPFIYVRLELCPSMTPSVGAKNPFLVALDTDPHLPLEQIFLQAEQERIEQLREGVLKWREYEKEIREFYQLYTQGPNNFDEEYWLEIEDGYTHTKKELHRIRQRLQEVKRRHMTDEINKLSDIMEAFDDLPDT